MQENKDDKWGVSTVSTKTGGLRERERERESENVKDPTAEKRVVDKK
jgi:hypothetical protein